MTTRGRLMRRTKDQLVDALLLAERALDLSPAVSAKQALASDKMVKWAKLRRRALDTIRWGEQ